MKELSKSLFESFLRLSSELSPENLTCDGELNDRQVQSKYRDIMGKWKKLEAKAGRKVTETEVWAKYFNEKVRK